MGKEKGLKLLYGGGMAMEFGCAGGIIGAMFVAVE